MPWRPKQTYHYIQNNYTEPDVIVDISNYWDLRLASIKAFKSQFHDPNSTEPESFISRPDFLDFVESRARSFGHIINTKYGEGFTTPRTVGGNRIVRSAVKQQTLFSFYRALVLWSQPRHTPAVACTRISQAVMQAAGPALPKTQSSQAPIQSPPSAAGG